jgi:hypothetical protein
MRQRESGYHFRLRVCVSNVVDERSAGTGCAQRTGLAAQRIESKKENS